MISLRTLAVTLAIAAPLAAQAVPTTNLILNGSFESPAISAGSWTVMPGKNYTNSPTKFMAGWDTDLTSGVEVRRGVAGAAQEGYNFIELDTHNGNFNNTTFDTSTNSWISQAVDTDLGRIYHLSYWYSPRGGVALASNDINVFWNGTLLTTNSGSGIGQGGHVWRQFEFDVTGTGGWDTLKFAAGGTENTYGGSLDNVSLVAAVPEPETYALMLAGLCAVGFVARRRQAR
ncbi:MAG: hypothetical protein B7Y51_03120 [Burkholderiales bacterium 28-67-8]|nr:MAG: hypothetical protein B7Y51_03120 [Burkholderiales bacterium 28-67-8]